MAIENRSTKADEHSAERSAPSALRRAIVDDRDGPLPALFLGLTVLAGVVDAVSILLAHVFVVTMTGNVVFLGLALTGAKGFSVATLALVLGAFALGALLGGRACHAAGPRRGMAIRNVLGVKVVLAAVVTVIAVLSNNHFSTARLDGVLALLAVSMGSQLAAVRYLKVRDLPTAMVTLLLIGVLTESRPGWRGAGQIRRVLAIGAFIAGVVAGGLLVRLVSVAAALGLGLAIIIVVAVGAQRASHSHSPWVTPAAQV